MVQREHTAPGTLIYDGSCSFCSSCVRLLERTLPVPPRCLPYQTADLGRYGITVAEAHDRVWLVTPRRHYGGHSAVAAILRHQPDARWRVWGRLAETPPWSWITAAGYTAVARNRHLLPGGTPACQLRS